MQHWFENLAVTDTDSKKYNDREAQLLQLAYRNIFVEEDAGQQVLCHIVTVVEDIKNDPDEHPEAKLMAIKLLDMITNNTGIIKDYTFIKAITGSARLIETKQEPKTESE